MNEMMKKQFFRVKQLADQTFLKAEKSEILNNLELQIADNKIEALKSAILAVNKKLCPNGPTTDKEKRLKKYLEYQLGLTFIEESKDENDRDRLFQHVLRLSGDTELDLAKDLSEHETKVEDMVYQPLQKLLDTEFPLIGKYRNNVKKYCLDRDSLSARSKSGKNDAHKDDLEEADTKVDQARDLLAIEMYNLLARENDIATCILQFLKLQRGYHESALKNLETVIPHLEKDIGNSHVKRVFGISLQEHLRVTQRRIAYPLEICITTLTEYGLAEEGLLRIAGSSSKVKRLKSSIDSGCFSTLIQEYRDVHVLASTLKSYLRELPEPLLTYHLFNDWMRVISQFNDQERIVAVSKLLDQLPRENFENLAYLMQFLARVADYPVNKMCESNIAIVIAPNLLWHHDENVNANMINCMNINELVELFIKESRNFFPDDLSNLVTMTDGFIPIDEDVERNNGSNNKLMNIEHVDATSTESLLDSPRPNLRKKKPAAPVPPPIIMMINSNNNENLNKTLINEENNKVELEAASATAEKLPQVSTLNRPSSSSSNNNNNNNKTPTKVKSSIGVNTEENNLSLSRKRSFSTTNTNKDDFTKTTPKIPPVPGPQTVFAQQQQQQTTEIKLKIDSPSSSSLVDKTFKTTAVHQTSSGEKPVAAPRQSLLNSEEKRTTVSRNPSTRSIGDFSAAAAVAEVQIRKSELFEGSYSNSNSRSGVVKPEIPARPASLAPIKRSSMDADPTCHKSQVFLSSVANKQQPSIVNYSHHHHLNQNRNEKIQLGHDVMMAEKEKFLGHAISLNNVVENKFNDENSNKHRSVSSRPSSFEKPSIPPKNSSAANLLLTTQSNEHLDNDFSSVDHHQVLMMQQQQQQQRKSNKNHSRTKSDGNIAELGQQNKFMSPSSRNYLNKPTEPPPPPPSPQSSSTVLMRKPEPESTDF